MSCGIVATFDYSGWVAAYPEFIGVTEPQGQNYWNMAAMFWPNDGSSLSPTLSEQQMLLNMLTSHFAARYVQSLGDASPGAAKDANTPPGAVATASTGSVSVTMKNEYPPGTAQWYQQTKYGSDFYAATAKYRTARFFQGQMQSGAGPFNGGFGGRYGGNYWGGR